jgi:hypothetical protein
MKRETAVELANAWYDLVEHSGAAGDHYSRLQGVLTSLLPEEVDHGAAGPVDGEMAVMAVKDGRLFVVRPKPGDAARAEMQVECLALVPSEVAIAVTDNPQDMADADPPGHFRRWEFIWRSGTRATLLGEVRRMRQWRGDGPDNAELFARAVAQRLGWDVPDQR